jgi:hypothetical protein
MEAGWSSILRAPRTETGKWVVQFTPSGPNAKVAADYVSWSNQDARTDSPDGVHLIVDADGKPFFDVKLLPFPPPSPPYFFGRRCVVHPDSVPLQSSQE